MKHHLGSRLGAISIEDRGVAQTDTAGFTELPFYHICFTFFLPKEDIFFVYNYLFFLIH